MPFCKTYQINDREQGETVQRDKSYRSYLMILLVFFFICFIFILTWIPWKIQNPEDHKDSRHQLQHHEKHMEETEILTTNVAILSAILTTTSTIITVPAKEIETITVEDHSGKNINETGSLERYPENRAFNETNSTSEENINEYARITKEILQSTRTEKKDLTMIKGNIDLITLPFNSVTENVVDDRIISTPINNTATNNGTTIDQSVNIIGTSERITVLDDIMLETSGSQSINFEKNNTDFNDATEKYLISEGSTIDIYKTTSRIRKDPYKRITSTIKNRTLPVNEKFSTTLEMTDDYNTITHSTENAIVNVDYNVKLTSDTTKTYNVPSINNYTYENNVVFSSLDVSTTSIDNPINETIIIITN